MDVGAVGGWGWSGAKTLAEDTTKETVRMPSASKAKASARAKANETDRIVDHLGATQGNAPTSRRARAKARDSNENVTSATR